MKSLLPEYELNALGIIKFILFNWIYIYGFLKQIINDNGSTLISKLNKLSHYILGIVSKEIFAYSPWVNGKSESKMKLISR